jgi:hypothetical protein
LHGVLLWHVSRFYTVRRQRAARERQNAVPLALAKKKHFYFLSIVVPTDGIKTAKLEKQ